MERNYKFFLVIKLLNDALQSLKSSNKSFVFVYFSKNVLITQSCRKLFKGVNEHSSVSTLS